ncbi:aspartate aminotransferase family protein [Aquamicrobium sp. LC103]|uniref:aspartate aminotransferase family protein n=1 Tax=Aquamicrobium sp. LC103 TaxID=1120658 RepID=UPI00063EAA22|nr:aspartate aminotransferase family protein [Aquamicrobium sp. LC103]TKT75846.1 aspartate aminotransferase family protein [Aquamicrobium sp. LC103]
MSYVLHRSSHAVPATVVEGRGCWLKDAEGNAYLDASGGAAVSCIGHGDTRVVDAIVRQAGKVEYAHNSFFTSKPAEQLAELLISRSPAELTKVYFVADGSEAVETALKLARQYYVERGESGRRIAISRRQSYHGNTLGALAIGGNMARRVDYAPLLMEVEHVSPCFDYRERLPAETPADYVARLAAELEETIARVGAQSVLCFVAETVVGATAGAVPPTAGYFRKIREICDRHGILLILDEVMCGTGRTGTFHAFEQEGIVPDILTNAKGLGGGYMPIGAVYLSSRIDETITNGSGAFKHGHTYNGHAIACAAALEVQKIISDDALVERADAQGQMLTRLLHERFGQHPHVGDIRGRGLIQAIELVADRETASPFDPKRGLAASIKSEAMRRGLCIYPGSGTIDGTRGDHVLLAPAFIVSDEEMAVAVERLGDAVDACISRIQIH